MKTYALIGDSQAEGLAPHLRALLGSALVHVEARRGRPTSEFDDVSLPEVDVVIAVLGGNDTATRSYPARLLEVATRLRRFGGRVVWVGPSASDAADTAARHDAARDVQAQILPAVVTWLDPRVWQVGPAGEHTPDGVHFTRAAYELQAAALLARIRRNWTPFFVGLGVASALGLGYALASR